MIEEGLYSAWDDMAVELEAAEFLYGLVRMLKPRLVYESGTGQGYASKYIARALQDNGFGFLDTFEADPHWAAQAAIALEGLPAKVHNRPLGGHGGDPDLVFLDSGPDYRLGEIEEWLPRDVPLVIHDAYRYSLEGGVMLPGRGLWLRV